MMFRILPVATHWRDRRWASTEKIRSCSIIKTVINLGCRKCIEPFGVLFHLWAYAYQPISRPGQIRREGGECIEAR